MEKKIGMEDVEVGKKEYKEGTERPERDKASSAVGQKQNKGKGKREDKEDRKDITVEGRHDTSKLKKKWAETTQGELEGGTETEQSKGKKGRQRGQKGYYGRRQARKEKVKVEMGITEAA